MTEEIYLSEKALAKKWGLSPKTLQRWRWLKIGSSYIKIGGRIRYTNDSIKDFENNNKHTPMQNQSIKTQEVYYA